ncbi:MAG: hypothetical protein JXQ82_01160 [Methanomicrobiaceae archaeon]|nr:hypothetical protein [Methanomicrobiaceae archaeon]
MKRKSLDTVKGENPEDKLKNLGIVKGKEISVLELNGLYQKYGIEIVLYFEKELAENSTYEKDLIDFADDNEFGRPFIVANKFIEFGKENDPSFESRLSEFPLMITIIDIGKRKTESGSKKLYIKGLMPFLDDFDVNEEPGPVIGEGS